MHDIKATRVVLTVSDHTNTSKRTSTGNHDKVASLELDERLNLASGNVDLYSVVDLDLRIRVADGTAIVRDKVRNALLAKLHPANAAKLVLSLLISDTVDGETALDVVDETEVLAGLGERDDIHETGRESLVSADSAVNLNKTLHQDCSNLTSGKRVLQTVTEEDNQWKGLPQLVGAGRRTRSVRAGKLVQHPVIGCGDPLHVLLRTPSHLRSGLWLVAMRVNTS